MRFLALVLCLALLSGCFGSFPLVNYSHTMQTELAAGQEGSFINKWTNQFLFLGMLPFYAISIPLDLLVTNPLEVWGGAPWLNDPPVTPPVERP